MGALQTALFENKVPGSWAKLAFEWMSGFFNPQSFLTAILQAQARKNEWPLDKVVVACEVTKKMQASEIDAHSREGSYTDGFTMEGARWDNGIGAVSPSLPKEMFCPMP